MRSGRVIGCRVDEATMLIIGLGRATAGDVVVTAGEDDAGTRSAFVFEWRLSAPSPRAKHGFAALLPTEGMDLAMATVRLGQEETGARSIFAPRLASAEEAGALVVETAGPQSASVINRLVDVLMGGDMSRRRLLTVTALLQAAQASDGFIELIGESHDGATFLQGWSRGMAPGPCRMFVVGGATPVVAECGIATFARQDAPDGASGFIGLLEARPGFPRSRDRRSGLSRRAPVGAILPCTRESASQPHWKHPSTSARSCCGPTGRRMCFCRCEQPPTALRAKKPSPACRFPSGWE
jgi:hypothetical protein